MVGGIEQPCIAGFGREEQEWTDGYKTTVVAGGTALNVVNRDLRIYTETGMAAMTKHPVFISPTRTGFSAHGPDLPGFIATGRTRGETLSRMQQAIEMHLRAIREGGDPIPEPSEVETLDVA